MTQGINTAHKQPRTVFNSIVAFPPNRDTMGGTAYLIILGNGESILVDCPACNDQILQYLHDQGGVRYLFLTHRGGMGKVAELQRILNCEVIVQEQEAYLLPDLSVTTFQTSVVLHSLVRGIWTPGHSPGSACLHYRQYGGVLFSGRHLLPDLQGNLSPIKLAKTFHWPRQIRSVRRLLDQFNEKTVEYICPGANIGFLRGKCVIGQAYQRLRDLDLEALIDDVS